MAPSAQSPTSFLAPAPLSALPPPDISPPPRIPPPPPPRIPPPPPSRIPPQPPSRIPPPPPSRIPPPPPSRIPPLPRIPHLPPCQIPPLPPPRIPPPPPPRIPPPPHPRIPPPPPPRPRQGREDRRPPFLLRATFYYSIYILLSSLVVIYFSTSFQLGDSPQPQPLGDRIVAAVYFLKVSSFTIGYGDVRAVTTTGKVIIIILDLISYLFISALISHALDDMINRLEVWYGFEGMEEAGRTYIRVACAIFVVTCGLLSGYIFIAYVFRLFGELDSIYLVLMTLMTIGYGDKSFMTLHGRLSCRLFAICWISFLLPAFDRACKFLVCLFLSCRFVVECEIFCCSLVVDCFTCIWLAIRGAFDRIRGLTV
ncbi:two pore potassium channel c-like isoform X2 [Argentina anserina]|nr:two pore potassium channel c-like isoform X2 [Potentilla anserina]